MKYTVEIPQLDDLQKAFRQAPDLVAKEVKTAGNRSLVRYQGTAKQKVPVRTGNLRGSLQVRPMSQQGNVIAGSMGTAEPYAIPMEEGTGIYGPAKRPIRPKRAKALVFTIGGQTIFARQVKGSKPHWYMRTSFEDNADATIRDFGEALDNVTAGLARRAR